MANILISKLNKQIQLEEAKLNKTTDSVQREALIHSIQNKKDLIKNIQLTQVLILLAYKYQLILN